MNGMLMVVLGGLSVMVGLEVTHVMPFPRLVVGGASFLGFLTMACCLSYRIGYERGQQAESETE